MKRQEIRDTYNCSQFDEVELRKGNTNKSRIAKRKRFTTSSNSLVGIIPTNEYAK